MRYSSECNCLIEKSEGDIMQLKLKKKEEAPAAAAPAAGAAAPAFAMPKAGGAGGMMTIELRGASIHVAEVIIRKK
jgi:CO dehydrogenase/acetyl-CoA synthase beta subunit